MILQSSLAILASILTIVIWLFSRKRRVKARLDSIRREIDDNEKFLASAIDQNATVVISTISDRLRILRKEYTILNRPG